VHICDDTTPTAHVTIAVEGVGWSSPDYFPMMSGDDIDDLITAMSTDNEEAEFAKESLDPVT
jgi:hypothetical protein